MTTETDPRVEIVARAIRHASMLDADTLVEISPFDTGPADHEDDQGRKFIFAWRKKVPLARAILAALDAARPGEPTAIAEEYYARGYGLRMRVVDYLNSTSPKEVLIAGFAEWESASGTKFLCAPAELKASAAARPVEPPADEEVAAAARRLRRLADMNRDELGAKYDRAAAATIERLSAEVARLTRERDEAERQMIAWRSAVQSCTPGGSEFMSPQAVRDWLQKMKTDRSRALATSVANAQRATAAEAEVADLRARLAQAEEALETIRARDIHPYVQIGDDPNFAGETVMTPGQYSKIAASTLATIKEDRT